MDREVKLSQLYTALDDLDYPVSRETAAIASDDVTLLLADGTIELDAVISDCATREFADRDDLLIEIMSYLPRRAVGEPFQSEGEG